MEFIKSNYKFPAEKRKITALVAKAKVGPEVQYGNFSIIRKWKDDMANVLSLGEREKLKQKGK